MSQSEENILDDNQLICALTQLPRKADNKELNLQFIIAMLNEEYGFELTDMERDYSVTIDGGDRTRRCKVSLAVFEHDQKHVDDNLARVCIVCDEKVKVSDPRKGLEATLDCVLKGAECEFGLWTNGDELLFLHRFEDDYGQVLTEDISDFPDQGQSFEDLEKRADRVIPRKPANDTLVRTFKRCHDYIYGNEGMKKTAFWELLNLIFCKIYDEKRRFNMPPGESYRRRFWVGVKERNTEEGLQAVSKRIKSIFNDLKKDFLYSEVFDGNEQINLSPRGIAVVAGELAKYSFLDATVDVKGMAYETIVSNTLKQEAGQFFTPRNIIKCMVEMLDPGENTRVLDPACGSGGFLVMVLDHVRKKIAKEMYDDLDDLHLQEKYNSPEVIERVKKYAERMIFGFDFDPDLKKAARMNMVMAGDGHANVFNINSLEYPKGDKEDVPKVNQRIEYSIRETGDSGFDPDCQSLNNALGKFDMVFTNPPFGSKVPVDLSISQDYDLGRNWSRTDAGAFVASSDRPNSSEAPEVLFIEQCCKFLKPDGKLAIVLPDGILGNPDRESTRYWILQHFKLLASVDLPVEAFLPQVGVQASLLFLQKKTEAEKIAAAAGNEDYDVFMAIAEAIGKDRRGVPVYQRDEDGGELLFEHVKKTLFYTANGHERISSKTVKEKRLADDLPKIAKAYMKFLSEVK